MIKMYRKLLVCLLLVCLLFITGCDVNNDSNNKIPEKLLIYTINDFHGAIEEDNGLYGAARISGFIKNSIKENSDAATLVISAGDMFQGAAISNHTRGEIVVDIMDEIGFHAMTIGNHEFDWELSRVLQYRDGDSSNGEANFPFLGCNIIEKETSSIPEYVDPYHIVETKGLKIGIIGYMGKGLESDIATSMIEDYYFSDPVEAVSTYAKELRVDEDCDIVIVSGHDGDAITNKQISKLEGDSRVDAIINGHTHSTYTETYRRTDGVVIPSIQTGTAGKNVGVITLAIDPTTKNVTSGSSFNKQMSKSVDKDPVVNKMVEDIVTETAPVFKRVLCKAGENFGQYEGARWAVNSLKDYMNTDVAFINSGGIRNSAFPIYTGEDVTVSKVYEIMPFDNTIKTVELQGKYIKSLMNSSGIVYSNNITGDQLTGFYINGELIIDDEFYTVAAVDYIFDQASYPFGLGKNSVATGILFRDILIKTLEDINNNGQTWLR